jgi:hypothetical protein
MSFAQAGRILLKDFKELNVWRKAHDTTLAIYELIRRFPKEEMFGLTSQIRRSAAFGCRQHR